MIKRCKKGDRGESRRGKGGDKRVENLFWTAAIGRLYNELEI